MTTSIQSLDAPLAFRLPITELFPSATDGSIDTPAVRTFVHALEGMQKQAVVLRGDGRLAWHLICDEGHYLNGTDLAPPPLAFFSAGMAAIYTRCIVEELSNAGHNSHGLVVSQDAYYGMQGSALRGTMKASADAVVLRVKLPAAIHGNEFTDRLAAAISRTCIDSLMRTQLADTFSIEKNGQALPTGDINQSTAANPGNPGERLAQVLHGESETGSDVIITKLESAESVFEADHGAGAALKDHQNRVLLIRSNVALRDDGLQKIRVQIHRPIGSVFEFLVDETAAGNDQERAPDGLSYVSAGIAFCFMTQLGRYAQITRKTIDDYSVVQDTRFDVLRGTTFPVDTHVYLASDEDDATCRKIVDMGERTCFLHAACRMSNKTRLCIECDGPTDSMGG